MSLFCSDTLSARAERLLLLVLLLFHCVSMPALSQDDVTRIKVVAAPLKEGTAPAAGTPVDAKVGEEFSLQPGRSAMVLGESLTLKFERVVSDSRCPAGVTCVWEGDAVVHIQLEGASGQTLTAELHTNPSLDAEVTFQGYRVRLVRLAPLRQEDSEIPPDSYVATLIVLRPDGRVTTDH